jgi:peptidyl-prolyl cis-trans isomerase B (cyclophilin B)
MNARSAFVSAAVFAALALTQVVAGQDLQVPGLRAALTTRSIVAANADVVLRLTILVESDTAVPSVLLNGAQLVVRAGGQPLKTIADPGRGEAVPLTAGTRIERTLTYPASSFLPNADGGEVVQVSVAWEGMAGVDCSFKVAPDTSKVDLATLDLARTEVVLVTSHGDMRLSFRPDKAPRHVENFVKLCLQGFYDGTRFHRVIRDFMIQGGCPKTKDARLEGEWGSGGPGYSLNAEFNDLRHLRGTLSMARTSDPNSAGSGFFLVHKDSLHLDGAYSAFGNLVEGADTLDRIANVPVGGPQNASPIQPVILHGAIVLPVKKKG